MADTDNTTPYRLWDQYGLTYHSAVRLYRCNATRESKTKWIARRLNRQDRHDARAALRRGLEPAPRQPRNRVLYIVI
jgi:hypothetical protein